MAARGDGPMVVTVMSILTAVLLVFTILRIYTRKFVVDSYGLDDHVYLLAFFLFFFYTVFVGVAAHYGFGQNMWEIDPPRHIMLAVLYECIAQTFAVIGMAVAKWSLGLFLLRLVQHTWHKIAIWVMMCELMFASLLCLFFFWLQCSPPRYLWDKSVVDGQCKLPQLEVSILLGASCVLTDLFFAIMPWVFIWKLQMNRRERLVILASMSLGIIAAACGIKRATEIPKLISDNYLKDSTGIIVWSAAEMAVTMICIGIPVCRPLYKNYISRLTSGGASSRYKDLSGRAENPAGVNLRTFGGGQAPWVKSGTHSQETSIHPSEQGRMGWSAMTSKTFTGDNNSEEEILGQGCSQLTDRSIKDEGIKVRTEYKVTVT